MNQVISCVHSGQRWREGSQIEAIALYNPGGGSDTRLQKFRASCETTNWTPGLLKSLEETPADVARGSSQQD